MPRSNREKPSNHHLRVASQRHHGARMAACCVHAHLRHDLLQLTQNPLNLCPKSQAPPPRLQRPLLTPVGPACKSPACKLPRVCKAFVRAGERSSPGSRAKLPRPQKPGSASTPLPPISALGQTGRDTKSSSRGSGCRQGV